MSDRKGVLVGKFLKVFAIVLAMLIIILGVITVVYVNAEKKGLTGNKETDPSVIDTNNNQGNDGDSHKKNENDSDVKKITSFAVFGVDKEGFRTDVIMTVFFNSETKKIDVISIPRDTKVKIPDDIYAGIKERRDDVPQFVKINEVSAYANRELRYETSVSVIEESFGIDIDYYIKMDLNGFRSIVDIVGPVTVDIPMDMKYEDPYQDLYINLSKGVQEINGAQAESLIRYRKGYDNQDLGRIEMQKEFMTAFLKELLTLENKMNIVNIAAASMVYVDTDFMDSVDYLQYIDDIYVENVRFATLPGKAVTAQRAYYIYDIDEAKKIFNGILAGDEGENIGAEGKQEAGEVKEPVEAEMVLEAKALKISVQNSTNIGGLAGRKAKVLNEKGYENTEAVDYKGDDVITKTRLLVPTKDVGNEIAVFFKNPEIIVNSDLVDKDLQVIIILGPEEGDN